MSNYFWTEERNNIVITYYNKFGKNAVKELKKVFTDKSEVNLRQKITSMIRSGILKKNKNDLYRYRKTIPEETKSFIENHIGKYTRKQFKDMTGLSVTSIRNIITRYKMKHRDEILKTKYDKFKEKMYLMKYQPMDLEDIESYEIEFICKELNISEEEFYNFRYKFINGNYSKGE